MAHKISSFWTPNCDHYTKNNQQNSRYGIEWSKIKNASHRWSHRHNASFSDFDFNDHYDEFVSHVKTRNTEHRSQPHNGDSRISHANRHRRRPLGYNLLLHPPTSRDLSPKNYLLISNLNECLYRKIFGYKEVIFPQTNSYFNNLDKKKYLEGFKKWKKRCTMWMELQVDFIE